MLLVFLCICLAFTALFCRISFLTDGQYVAANANLYGSRVIEIEINSSRGVIYDRNLNLLAGGNYIDACLVEPMSLDEQSRQAVMDSSINISAAELEKKISSGQPFLVHVSSKIQGSGLTSIMAIKRYSDSGYAQNLLGYLDSSGKGVYGIESAFDALLQSEEQGYTAVFKVDAARMALAGLGLSFENSPLPVTNGVVLTLDADIQKIAEEAADAYVENGAIIVSEIDSGKIIAAVSRPAFDADNIGEYLNDENGAMLFKPFETFSCGSAFKIVVAAAALESGIDLNYEYECTGSYNAVSNIIGCGKTQGHGLISFREAFADSCNTYFCDLAARVGAEKIYEMAEKFGFGKPTYFWAGMTSASGSLPALADLFSPASLANLAIGQGVLQVTPLQVMNMASVIANGGVLNTPILIDGFVSQDGQRQVIESSEGTRIISQNTADIIREMMIYSTVSVSGTGVKARPVQYGAGVKTSSAQTGIIKDGNNVLHTWVCGFFPAVEPKYAVAVLVEGGTSGYSSAAPVFAEFANKMILCGYVTG